MTMVDDRPLHTAGDRWATVKILLVEDNQLDARSIIRAARKLDVAGQIDVLTDGQSALDRLRRDRAAGESIGLVLLDLNLPGKDGHDVLAEIRADAALRSTPVVILTSSAEPADVDGAYQRGANAYVTKPTGIDGWLDAMTTIREFWLSLAVLPGQ